MELFVEVLQKLQVPVKNDLKCVHLKPITVKSDNVIRLSFTTNDGDQEYILIKINQVPEVSLYQKIEVTNAVLPVCTINHSNISYAVFDGQAVEDYKLKEDFDQDHVDLVLSARANFHGSFMAKALTDGHKQRCDQFYKSLENILQKIEVEDDGSVNGNKKALKHRFEQMMETIKTSLDENYWVPSFEGFEKNTIFFKYNDNGKPSDFIILTLQFCNFVPPVYDILIYLFTHTNENERKIYLSDFLQRYYNLLKNKMENKIFDLEQFNFQIRSFIPLIKFSKCVFSSEKKHCVNGFLNNLEEYEEIIQYPNLLREDCYDILQKYLEHTNYTLQKYVLTPLPQRSGNLGDYFRLKLNIIVDKHTKEINLFAKFLPSNNEFTNEITRSGPFSKEEFFYNNFISEFKKFGLNKYLDFAPKCFLTKTNHVLILEDLGVQGYQLIPEQTFFSLDMVNLTLKKLAQLHACSLVLEEVKSKELQKKFRLDEHFSDFLQEILFQTEEQTEMKILSDIGEKTVTDYMIYLFPEVVKNMTMDEFRERSVLAFKSFYKKHMKSDKFRNTLCHGDTWATNIMLKFDSNNSPVDCKLVDYQLTRYCPPIQDVMAHIYVTTIKETRTQYLTIWLDQYYKELSTIVTSYGFDMEKVLSEADFRDSCEYMKSQAVCQALFYAPLTLTTAEDRLSIFGDPESYDKLMKKDRSPFIELMMNKYPFYRERLGELIEDLYEVCENEQY